MRQDQLARWLANEASAVYPANPEFALRRFSQWSVYIARNPAVAIAHICQNYEVDFVLLATNQNGAQIERPFACGGLGPDLLLAIRHILAVDCRGICSHKYLKLNTYL
jgi:hypothetical protein